MALRLFSFVGCLPKTAVVYVMGNINWGLHPNDRLARKMMNLIAKVHEGFREELRDGRFDLAL